MLGASYQASGYLQNHYLRVRYNLTCKYKKALKALKRLKSKRTFNLFGKSKKLNRIRAFLRSLQQQISTVNKLEFRLLSKTLVAV